MDGGVATWVYSVFHVGMILSVGMTVLLTLWTLLLLTAALWLGLSPAWIWIVALDPWSLELVGAIGGLVLRALFVQASAWAWVAGVVILDGGSDHGPFGLPVAFTGLTPWLSIAWTIGWIAVVWRFWVVPLWLLIRRIQIDVTTWWAHHQLTVAQTLQHTGTRVGSLSTQLKDLGWEPAQWGQMLGQTMTDAGGRLAEQAAWRGMAVQWSSGERAAAEASRWGTEDGAWSHPASTLMHPATADTNEPMAPPAHWTTHWTESQIAPHIDATGQQQAPSSIWTTHAATSMQAEITAKQIQEQLQQAVFDDRAKQYLMQNHAEDYDSLPDTVRMQKISKDAANLAAAWARGEHSPPADLFDSVPHVVTEGTEIRVQPNAFGQIPPPAVQILRQPAVQKPPVMRRRYGRVEIYREGVWTAQAPSTGDDGHAPD
jgi:hypothetical protein